MSFQVLWWDEQQIHQTNKTLFPLPELLGDSYFGVGEKASLQRSTSFLSPTQRTRSFSSTPQRLPEFTGNNPMKGSLAAPSPRLSFLKAVSSFQKKVAFRWGGDSQSGFLGGEDQTSLTAASLENFLHKVCQISRPNSLFPEIKPSETENERTAKNGWAFLGLFSSCRVSVM